MKPILYSADIDVRFSDLDPYGHVNMKHYFDYVVNSRLMFMKRRFDLTLEKIAALGTGFYATAGEIKYLRPINGMCQVHVESYIASIDREQWINIPFVIKHSNSDVVYSQGRLTLGVVDTRTGKLSKLSHEMHQYFFEE